ncbi:hypothetical protein CMI37_04200 [Candidatus Pacearchaeota archaeon]|nr:hypothetical protein [Candidatus Pacearchaeota archaeon]
MAFTKTETLDNLYTSTWQNMKDTVVDNIFDATPFWFWMKDGGHFATQDGGRDIQHPIRFAKGDNVSWITKGSTVTMDDKEILTDAIYDWRYLSDSIVRFMTDEQKNAGKHRIFSLMKAKLDTSQDTLIDTLETALFAAQTGNQIDGLQTAVADDPTATANVGGIAQGTHSWWRNKTTDLTGNSFAVNGIPNMRTIMNNIGNNLSMDKPNIILSGQTPYEYYEDNVIEQKQIVNKKLGDAGFENLEFKGTPMIWSPACANTRMYFLNTRFLKVIYDPALWFDMTDWKQIPNQPNDRVAQVVSALALVCSRRRAQGVIFNIDTE